MPGQVKKLGNQESQFFLLPRLRHMSNDLSVAVLWRIQTFLKLCFNKELQRKNTKYLVQFIKLPILQQIAFDIKVIWIEKKSEKSNGNWKLTA